MPINFLELENILIEWKISMSRIKRPMKDRTAKFVYKKMKEKAKTRYAKKISELIKSIDIDEVELNKVPNRTTGDLESEIHIIHNLSSL
jgi:hypothetical protein